MSITHALTYLLNVPVFRVLPFTSDEPMHFLHKMVPAQCITNIGVKFNEFTVDKGVEAAYVGTHSKGRKQSGMNVKIQWTSILRSFEMKTIYI